MSKPSDDAIIAQQFADALRECLGLAPLYRDPGQTDAERFYVRHVEPKYAGHTRPGSGE